MRFGTGQRARVGEGQMPAERPTQKLSETRSETVFSGQTPVERA